MVLRMFRWKQLKNTIFLLLPFLLYIIFQCSKTTRQWCEGLRYEYPIKANLETFRLKNRENILIDGIFPINEIVYEFIHEPNQDCRMKEISILSIVKSKPDHYGLRDAIRKTWGKQASNQGNKLVFSLGKIGSHTLQRKIDEESNLYRDILQGTFNDAYFNNTLKTMNGIYWIAKRCPHPRFVSMIDDDVVVNFFNIEKFFSEVQFHKMNSLFVGFVYELPSPFRFRSKWSIPLEEYQCPCYPPFVTGATLLTTGSVIKMLNAAIPYVKRFVLDDVYLGIIAMKLGIELTTSNNHQFDLDGSRIHELPCIISSHQEGDISRERYKELYFSNIKSSCF